MRLTPEMSDRPAATRNSELGLASPFRNCSRIAEPLTRCAALLFAQRADLWLRRLECCAVGVAPVHHHAVAVLLRELADVRAHGRLMIERAPDNGPERRRHLEALEGLDELFGVGRAGLLHRR